MVSLSSDAVFVVGERTAPVLETVLVANRLQRGVVDVRREPVKRLPVVAFVLDEDLRQLARNSIYTWEFTNQDEDNPNPRGQPGHSPVAGDGHGEIRG
jgi:hypothetical protein